MSAVAVSPSQASLRDEVRAFVHDEVEPIASDHDRSAIVPGHLVERFFDRGLTTRFLGDGGPDPAFVADACIACDELAYGSAAIASLLMLPVFFGRLVLQHLAEPARSYLAARFREGPVVIAFAASERGAGSDMVATEVNAKRIGDAYVLRGRKEYSSNLRQASFAIVLARTGPDGVRTADGFTCFLVDLADPAVRIGNRWPTLGLRAMDLSPLELDGVRVPDSFVLGREGRALAMMANSLSQSRTGVAAVVLGIVRRARDDVFWYGRDWVIYGECFY
jgi:alkylation response protein AidB-like acyl-CoA dehydrogenase